MQDIYIQCKPSHELLNVLLQKLMGVILIFEFYWTSTELSWYKEQIVETHSIKTTKRKEK